MEIQCPHCKTSITATPEHYGLIVSCPECNGQFTINKEEGEYGCAIAITVILVILAFCFFFPSCLPTGIGLTKVPVKVSIRGSYIGNGLVATISNPSSRTIKGLKITCKNSRKGQGSQHTCNELKQYDTYEVGWLEGWIWEPGEELTVKAYGYRAETWIMIGRSFMLKSELKQKIAEVRLANQKFNNTITFTNKIRKILLSYYDKFNAEAKKKYSSPNESLKVLMQLKKAVADEVKQLDSKNIDSELSDYASDFVSFQYTNVGYIQKIIEAKTEIEFIEANKIWEEHLKQESSFAERLVKLRKRYNQLLGE